jgi:1-acyl-sn-glycerol-3-phosphate acyltransferase
MISLRSISHFVASLYYRRVAVTGAHHVPTSGPLLILSSHTNRAIDTILLHAVVNRRLSIVVRHDVLPRVIARFVGWILGWIFVFRAHGRVNRDFAAKNAASVQLIAERLVRGGAICLFPEGTSSRSGALNPLRGGAARVLQETMRRRPIPPVILPVVIRYEARSALRSRVWVRFGVPIPTLAANERRRAFTLRAERALEELSGPAPTRRSRMAGMSRTACTAREPVLPADVMQLRGGSCSLTCYTSTCSGINSGTSCQEN